MNSPNLPEPGQLVHVRGLTWVVNDIRKSTLSSGPLQDSTNASQHLLELTSVEDDAYGEELQVIWEIEPGARLFEKANLPKPVGFDEPRRLDAFLDAVRWGAIESADSRALQSPFRSGISIEDYQLDPVVRALQMPRVNLLIADDVGLGKTIEAGLVAQEMILRHRVRSILVVVPASLQIKWLDEMRKRFGLEFRIVDSTLFKELRRRRGIHVNPWTHFPRLITSVDFLKRERPLRLFRETLPPPGQPIYPRKYDLLIVDEAHNVAPAGSGNYAIDSQRTHAIRWLAPHFEHKLFLTATPHNGYWESFSALLELLDDQRFARTVKPDEKQLRAVMVHRLKTEIVDWDGRPKFKERKIEAIEVDYTDAEREAHHKLQRYAELRQLSASSGSAKLATEFVLKLLKKRMFSSPAAFLSTLYEHEKTLKGVRVKTAKRPKPSASVLRRELLRSEEDWADDDAYETASKEAVETATNVFESLGNEEKLLLAELSDWGARASARPDVKCRTLIAWLEATVRPKGDWNNDRVIIFTEYRATQKWLQEQLAGAGLAGGGRLLTLYGGMPSEDREAIKAAFQARPTEAPVRILLATDAASEGIDLQNYCHRVVHYEIPWNPNRLEQRNGRIDRHGQKNTPLIYHFVGAGWHEARQEFELRPGDLEGDLEFLAHAARKVDRIRADLGKVGPVIERKVEGAMLGGRGDLDTRRAEDEAKPIRKAYKFEKDLQARIGELRERISESKRELRVTPKNVLSVVKIGLELADQPALEDVEFPGVWPDPSGCRTECPIFRMPRLQGTWAACAEGLAHPHSGVIRPIVFDHELAAEIGEDVVLVHLNHRLVQMCQRLLRAEVWASGERRKLFRVAARVVPSEAMDSPVVVAQARLVVMGGTDSRLHEEVIAVGGAVREGKFSRMNVSQTKAAIDAATSKSIPTSVKAQLQRQWAKIEDSITAALEAMMKERTKSLEGVLTKRATKEIDDITTILTELERNIRAELEAEPPIQYEMFDQSERDQVERNQESLRRRLSSIPEEIERETRAVRKRYSDPVPRHFPVSVTFLIPERLAH